MAKHHPLSEEFPEYQDKLHYARQSDQHFRRLCEEYEEVDKAIARSESRIDLRSELDEEKLRKQRLSLKEQIFAVLSGARKHA